MTAAAEKQTSFPTIQRPTIGAPIFTVTGASAISIRAGTWLGDLHIEQDTPIPLPALVAGTDYAVRMMEGAPVAAPCSDGVPAEAIGGFHFAPGGNATARAGGDSVPAINPFSCWDIGFRPVCPDPRGMALVEHNGLRFWCDIYLLGTDHLAKGTSRFGQSIADGRSLPLAPDGSGKVKKLDYATAVAIYAHHGKQLLAAEEFFAAADGVTERSSANNDPETTGLDAPRTSRFGVMQATGNMWVWCTDGHPTDPRPSIFGGSWFNGGSAGSRCAYLGRWPDRSYVDLSARGRSDHLTLV